MRATSLKQSTRTLAAFAAFAAVIGLGSTAALAQKAQPPRLRRGNQIAPGETGGIPDDLNRGLPGGPLGNPELIPAGDRDGSGRDGEAGNDGQDGEPALPPAEVLDEVGEACDRAVTGCRTALDNCLPTDGSAPNLDGSGQTGANTGAGGTPGAGGGAIPGFGGNQGNSGPGSSGAAGSVDALGNEIAGGGSSVGSAPGSSGGVLGGTNGGFGTGANGAGGINDTSSTGIYSPGIAGEPPARKKRWWEKLLGAVAEGVGRGVAGALSNQVNGARGQFNDDMRGISQRHPESASWLERFGRGFADELTARTMREAANRAGVPSTFPGAGGGVPPFATPPFNPNAPDPRFQNFPTNGSFPTDPRAFPVDPRTGQRFDPRTGRPVAIDPRTGQVVNFPTTTDPRFGLPGTGFPDQDFRFPRPTQQQSPTVAGNGGTANRYPQQRRVPKTFPVVDDGAGNRRVQVTIGISFGLGR